MCRVRVPACFLAIVHPSSLWCLQIRVLSQKSCYHGYRKHRIHRGIFKVKPTSRDNPAPQARAPLETKRLPMPLVLRITIAVLTPKA